MNLNEAAEIVRGHDKPWLKQNLNGDKIVAYTILIEEILDWLDPTSITEEWLEANGWMAEGSDWHCNSAVLWRTRTYWSLATKFGRWRITTIGELRTLLRLCTQEKENDA